MNESQEWIWRHFRFELPRDWEMLRFGKDLEKGCCAFADRYGYRLEWNWRRLTGEPDLDRMSADYASKLVSDRKMEDVENIPDEESAGWKGVKAKQKDLVITRFIRFNSAEKCLLELVFSWPDLRSSSLERAVLSSFRIEPVIHYNGEKDAVTWKAYGMEWRVSGDLSIKDCLVQPGNVKIVFSKAAKASRREESYERRGLVTQWLTGTVKDWLLASSPYGLFDLERDSENLGSHRIENLHGSRPRKSIWPLFGGKMEYRASAWICPENKRLYRVSVSYPRGEEEEIKLPGGRLSCCPAMGAKS